MCGICVFCVGVVYDERVWCECVWYMLCVCVRERENGLCLGEREWFMLWVREKLFMAHFLPPPKKNVRKLWGKKSEKRVEFLFVVVFETLTGVALGITIAERLVSYRFCLPTHRLNQLLTMLGICADS